MCTCYGAGEKENKKWKKLESISYPITKLSCTQVQKCFRPLTGIFVFNPSPGMLDSTALKGLFAAGRIFSGQRKQPLPEKNSPKATIYEERRGFANP